MIYHVYVLSNNVLYFDEQWFKVRVVGFEKRDFRDWLPNPLWSDFEIIFPFMLSVTSPLKKD